MRALKANGAAIDRREPSRETRNLSILLEVSKALASHVRLDDLLFTIMSKTAEVLDAERATLFLYDPARQELWSKTADQLEITEIRLPLGAGIAGDVAQTRLVANIPDAYDDPRFNQEFDRRTGYRTRSVLSMPLIGADDELVGVIQVLNKKGQAAFDEQDESLLRGLTAHVSVAIERAHLIEAYIEKDRSLEIQNNAKTKMIAHLSHELRTPLAIVSASCSLLRKLAATHEPERAQAIAERLQRAIDRLVELQVEAADIAQQRQVKEDLLLTDLLRRCQDLLESLVDEHGNLAGRDAPTCLSELLTERIAEIYSTGPEQQAEAVLLDVWVPSVLESLRAEFEHRQITLELALQAGPAVYLPESPLFKSFRGLLRNAIEATPDGGTIQISVQEANGSLRLEIRDTGVGIDPELQEQLFHGFVHAGSTESYSSGRPYDFGAGGKGLDLQRIKLFSERLGFQLHFSSQVGAGSAFGLEFPPDLLRPRDR
jgi:signal transduction histidine kinase